ncbi:MAG TPA: hypothetical protein PKA41_03305 [Verrucomicrobiota bacterium]|nr:hypothetical protein [Verrucomicrobiota bacterium]
MTPARHREQLHAELAGLNALLHSAPEDPLATPLMRSRVEEIEESLRELGTTSKPRPEAEIFFVDGPAIGSEGIEITFASDVLESYQNMVTNHYSAKVYGRLRRSGRRRKEDETRLYLTALPRGSFGFQLSQPYTPELFAAQNMVVALSDISGLVEATAESDESFEAALASFDSRVFRPLKRFITTIHAGGGACRLLTGERQTNLSVEKIAEAYDRISAAITDDEEVTMSGTFGGFHAFSGDFEFQPDVGRLIQGGLNEEINDEIIAKWTKQFFQQRCIAKMTMTTVSQRTGNKKPTYELVALKPLAEEKVPGEKK